MTQKLQKLSILGLLALLTTTSWAASSSFLISTETAPAPISTTLTSSAVEVPTTVTVDDEELMTINEAEETMGETIVEDSSSDFVSIVE